VPAFSWLPPIVASCSEGPPHESASIYCRGSSVGNTHYGVGKASAEVLGSRLAPTYGERQASNALVHRNGHGHPFLSCCAHYEKHTVAGRPRRTEQFPEQFPEQFLEQFRAMGERNCSVN
jgi:hypothetical protein